MPQMPVISGDEFVKALNKIGYIWDHTEGSHMILIHLSGRRLAVPRHPELGQGLLSALMREAGLSRQGLIRLLRT
jgi:predicted RNA binding protein YcfA (HicA-like mRNA interferase family)